MTGQTDLGELKRQMAPQLQPGIFVFCTFQGHTLPRGMTPIGLFHESEGITAVVDRAQAIEAKVPFEFEARQITLTVYSSLNAVGFMAVISSALASAGIPCNVISAFHHDHLFIPVAQAEHALSLLKAICETHATVSQ